MRPCDVSATISIHVVQRNETCCLRLQPYACARLAQASVSVSIRALKLQSGPAKNVAERSKIQ